MQALDNGQRGNNIGNTYLSPPTNVLPIPPMQLILPNLTPAQPFAVQQQQSHGSGSSSSSGAGYSFQNQELTHVHVIHDCGKGPQLNQGGYAAPAQNYASPTQSYGTPLGQPLDSYQSPIASQLQGLSDNYEVPSGSLAIPQHNSINFNSPSNSYGPPGPASLDVIGLESQQRANTVVAEHQNIISAGTTNQVFEQALPGLSTGLSGSGLNFLSAQKSHSIDVPSQGGHSGAYQLQFVQSHSGQNSNSIDSQNHDNILADGLLSSIISAIEKKPAQTVPQVTEDQETDHSEVQVFLKSPEGQVVLADKPVVSHEEHHDDESS